MPRHPIERLAACLALAVLIATAAGAAGARDERRFVQAPADERPLARDRREAAELARQRSGGRVLSSDPADTEDGRPAYRVKILTPEGHVRVIVIEGRRERDE